MARDALLESGARFGERGERSRANLLVDNFRALAILERILLLSGSFMQALAQSRIL